MPRRWHLDLLLALAGTVPSAAWGFKSYNSDKTDLLFPITLWAFAVIVAVGGTWKALWARQSELKYEPSKEPDPLVEWCRNLYHLLKHAIPDELWDYADVRITIHKVNRLKWNSDPYGFQQLTNYVGGQQQGLGRIFSIRPGIIGLVSRYGKPIAMIRNGDADVDFIKEMVLDWGYTWDEAGDLCSDRNTWMALPLTDVDGVRVIGVIYLDSAKSETFTEQIQELVVVQSESLAETVRTKYNRGSQGSGNG